MSARTSFHSMQAASQALQPMHFDTSMSFATSVSCRSGGGTVEADRRIRSASPRLILAPGSGLGSWNSNAMTASLCHRPGEGLDIDQERLVFRRLDVGVADIGRKRVRAEAFPRFPHEAPVQRDAD